MEVLTVQGEIDGGFDETEFIAYIVAGSLKIIGVNSLGGHQPFDGIGQLNFTAGARGLIFQQVKDLRSQHITTQDSQPTGGFFLFGLWRAWLSTRKLSTGIKSSSRIRL